MTSEESKVLKDYSLEQVPSSQRKPWIDLAMVWIGAAIVVSALLRGMMIGMGLGSIKSVLLAYLLGEVLLIGMMSLTGFMGAKTGLSTPMLARLAFGTNGNLLISTCIALTFMGWFGVQVGLFSEAVVAYTGTTIPVAYLTFFSGILLMIPAIFGFKGLKALSYAAVPVMVIIFIYGAIKMGHNLLPPDKLIELAKANLGEAIAELKNDHLFRSVLGNNLFEEYIKLKEWEWDLYNQYVSPWEVEHYLEAF